MKTFFLTIVFFSISVALIAKTEEFENKISKNFNVNEKTLLKIDNKFGNVNIKNWQKNEVEINVSIVVDAKSKEKADKVFNKITIDISENKNIISAITNIENQSTFKIFYISSSNEHDSYSINYEINAPVYILLDLNNKFGDVFINELHSKSDINIKYGDLKANNLLFPDVKPYSKITLSYGSANIDKLTWCNYVSKYSDSEITESQALFIYSRYSEYVFDKNIAIICDSKFDDYKIDTCENFVLTGAYNDVKIKKIIKQFVIDSKYGDYKISNISENFKKIKLITAFTDLSLGLSKKSNFKINLVGIYSEVNIPSVIFGGSDYDDDNLNLKGSYNNKDSKNIISASLKYGDLKIFFYDN